MTAAVSKDCMAFAVSLVSLLLFYDIFGWQVLVGNVSLTVAVRMEKIVTW